MCLCKKKDQQPYKSLQRWLASNTIIVLTWQRSSWFCIFIDFYRVKKSPLQWPTNDEWDGRWETFTSVVKPWCFNASQINLACRFRSEKYTSSTITLIFSHFPNFSGLDQQWQESIGAPLKMKRSPALNYISQLTLGHSLLQMDCTLFPTNQ